MSENTTRWAGHFEAATSLMLDGMARPHGETFAYARAEALRASDAAGTDMETELAQQLARNIAEVALDFNIRLAVVR